MQVVSLHPLDLDVVQRYVDSLLGGDIEPAWQHWYTSQLQDDVQRAIGGDETAANRITRGLACALGQAEPFFVHRPFGLTFWEAHVDRPIGMLMRPPSRLFQEAGLSANALHAMPIRLDVQAGMMGGAFIPARLIDQAVSLLEDHLERVVKRLVDAEHDPIAAYGLMCEALHHAREHGVGVFEAMDVVGPEGQGLPGARVLLADPHRLDPALRDRIVAASRPPKKPGLLTRLFGRSSPPSTNGHHPTT